mmetsp:Transcript_18744/g.47430  ORF Transcript_18744/g.47430 Transcript_18744/m.47430 type:complete len:244 (+) Transcript_18744:729-1460(+)
MLVVILLVSNSLSTGGSSNLDSTGRYTQPILLPIWPSSLCRSSPRSDTHITKFSWRRSLISPGFMEPRGGRVLLPSCLIYASLPYIPLKHARRTSLTDTFITFATYFTLFRDTGFDQARLVRSTYSFFFKGPTGSKGLKNTDCNARPVSTSKVAALVSIPRVSFTFFTFIMPRSSLSAAFKNIRMMVTPSIKPWSKRYTRHVFRTIFVFFSFFSPSLLRTPSSLSFSSSFSSSSSTSSLKYMK